VTYVYKENKSDDHQEEHNNHNDQSKQKNSPDYRWTSDGHDRSPNMYRDQLPHTGEKTTFSLVTKIAGLMVLLITGMIFFYRKKGNKRFSKERILKKE
ncbi:LPXTG cell wall anchor domain-containing protein, partial [Enterococcus faecalis]|nr:LPXTG cell wall anchor domain-containing protein [Enterococcus faecalis]